MVVLVIIDILAYWNQFMTAFVLTNTITLLRVLFVYFALHFACRDDDAPAPNEVGVLYAEPAFVRTGVGSVHMAAAEPLAGEASRTELKL